MTALPQDVAQHLARWWTGGAALAWIALDGDGRVLEHGGDLAAAGLDALAPGEALVERVELLSSYLPLEDGEVYLPQVAIGAAGEQRRADLHLFHSAGRDLVVAVDSTRDAGFRQRSQQSENEWRLLRARLARAGGPGTELATREEVTCVAAQVRLARPEALAPRAALGAVAAALEAARTALAPGALLVERLGGQTVGAVYASRDAERAARAAGAAARALDGLADLDAGGRDALAIGVGLARGAALVAALGEGDASRALVVGAPQERALALAAGARAGEVAGDAPAPDALAEVLGALDTAVLERVDEGLFRPLGAPPAWLGELLAGAGARDDGCLRPGDELPFLDNFLFDAEALWARGEPGRASSGPWTETAPAGGEWPLEATALALASGRRVLLVQRLGESFETLRSTLQRARTGKLEHEALQREVGKKEILLHCIVHDLRNPLSTITGSLSILTKAPAIAPERRDRLIEASLRQARRQDDMIRGILETFAAEVRSLDAFEVDPASAPDALACGRDAVAALEPEAQRLGKHVELVTALEPEAELRAVGRRDRLERVLGNLLGNALRYGPSGSAVRLVVARDGDAALLGVEDEGPGVPAELRERLFEKLSQGEGRSKGVAGLGLYYCRMTVEAWGGSIGVGDREGGGARFWFRLPLAGTVDPRGETLSEDARTR